MSWNLKLKITEKCILLVAIPLVFELIFALSLSSLLWQAEGEIKREWLSRQISSELARLQYHIYNCATNAAGVRFDSAPKFKSMYASNITELSKCRVALLELVGGDRERASYLAPVESAGELAMIKCGLLCIPKDGNSEIENLLGGRDSLVKLLKVCEEFAAAQSRFMEHERAIEQEAPTLRALRREQIQALLIVAIAVSLMLCLALSIYFGADTSSRLLLVAENIRRFKDGKKLSKVADAGDEISELAACFEHMAVRLRENEVFKNQLIAVVSHELRTPLTSVSGALAVVESGMFGEMSPEAHRRLVEIERDLDSVMRLSTLLLQIERMESGNLPMQFEECDLMQVLQELLTNLELQKPGIDLEIIQTEGNGAYLVRLDRRQFQNAVKELLLNAAEASSNNGKITLNIVENEKQILLHIEDDGAGVPEELVREFAGPSERMSVGLGLTLCRAVARQHGGSIALSRRAHGGSRATFILPKNKDAVLSQKSH